MRATFYSLSCQLPSWLSMSAACLSQHSMSIAQLALSTSSWMAYSSSERCVSTTLCQLSQAVCSQKFNGWQSALTHSSPYVVWSSVWVLPVPCGIWYQGCKRPNVILNSIAPCEVLKHPESSSSDHQRDWGLSRASENFCISDMRSISLLQGVLM